MACQATLSRMLLTSACACACATCRHARMWMESKLEMPPGESLALWVAVCDGAGHTTGLRPECEHPRQLRVAALGDGTVGSIFRAILGEKELPWLEFVVECARLCGTTAGDDDATAEASSSSSISGVDGGAHYHSDASTAFMELQRYQSGAATTSLQGACALSHQAPLLAHW